MFHSSTQGNGHSRFQTVPASQRPAVDSSGESMTHQALDVAKSAAQTVMDKVGKCIADHPGISLGAAVTCGVIIGWLIKRTS